MFTNLVGERWFYMFMFNYIIRWAFCVNVMTLAIFEGGLRVVLHGFQMVFITMD